MIKILLVGAGGYARKYIDALLDNTIRNDYIFAGIVDPFFNEKCVRKDEIIANNIPVFNSMDEYYADNYADLVIVSTPIQFHCKQVCIALKNKSNVLCEKPLAMSIAETLQIKKTLKENNKFVVVGYQLNFAKEIAALKRDISLGMLGKPVKFRTYLMAHRSKFSDWIGKMYNDNGEPIFDSIMSNPGSHYLINMFSFLTSELNTVAIPQKLTAELYSSGYYETYDCIFLKSTTFEGVESYFAGTILTEADETDKVAFEYEFENATVSFDTSESLNLFVKYKDGRTVDYGEPFLDELRKLWTCVETITNGDVLVRSLDSELIHPLIIREVHNSVPNVVSFPEYMLKPPSKSGIRTVIGMKYIILNCTKNFAFPSELNYEWAKKGKEIIL